MSEILSRHLSGVKVGDPVSFRALTTFPLTSPVAGAAEYITLDEALAAGTAAVREVSESGAVSALRFVNEGDSPVLILDGEELVGAKQNRIVNVTILAPAGRTIEIPVSCVEAGRWAYRSPEFSSAGRAVYAGLRSRLSEDVGRSLAHGSRASDQSAVWEDIGEKSRRMHAPSPTDAMAAIYEENADPLDDFAAALRAQPGQSGVVFAIRDRIVGLDLFDAPETFGKLNAKLVGSYALDAMEAGGGAFDAPGRDAAARLVADLAGRTQRQVFPAIGDGTEIRMTGTGVTGSALIAGERAVHVAAFRRAGTGTAGHDEEAGALHSRLSPASRRRRMQGS